MSEDPHQDFFMWFSGPQVIKVLTFQLICAFDGQKNKQTNKQTNGRKCNTHSSGEGNHKNVK